MTDNDRDNLDFLMNISSDALKAWYAKASGDDIMYAGELLTAAISANVEDSFENLDEPTDLTQANSILSKYMLGTK